MPPGSPPKETTAEPRYVLLPPGSFLWRVTGGTQAASGQPADALWSNRVAQRDSSGRLRGGRFHPTAEHPYPYCYAALDDLTALCETLLRDVGFNAPLRYLPWRSVEGRHLVLLETLQPLWLVSLLKAEDLAAARQDTWLIHAEKPDYAMTREWGHWLRGSPGPDGSRGADGSGWPAGIMWPSKRQPTGRAVMLFGDRCQQALTRSALGARRLDDDAGLAWLNRRLSLLNTRVALPSSPRTPKARTARTPDS